jgi:hypothetical protein
MGIIGSNTSMLVPVPAVSPKSCRLLAALGFALVTAACAHPVERRITTVSLPVGQAAFAVARESIGPATAVVAARLRQFGWQQSDDADLIVSVSASIRPRGMGIIVAATCQPGDAAAMTTRPRSRRPKAATVVTVAMRLTTKAGETRYAETIETFTYHAHPESRVTAVAAALLAHDPRLVTAADPVICVPSGSSGR